MSGPAQETLFYIWRLRRKLQIPLQRARRAGLYVTGHHPSLAFGSWARRPPIRGGTEFPYHWRADAQIEKPAKVAVVLHVESCMQAESVILALASIPVPFDLFVLDESPSDESTKSHSGALLRDSFASDSSESTMLNAQCRLSVSVGTGNVLSLVWLVNAGALDPYRLILNLAPSDPEWDEPGGPLASLLANEESVTATLNAFASDADLGVVTAGEHRRVLSSRERRNVEQLLRRVECPAAKTRIMEVPLWGAWTRGLVIQGLRALDLSSADFDRHGFFAPATTTVLAATLGTLVEEAGYKAKKVSDLGRESTGAWRHFDANSSDTPRARVMPFYLPQYHPTPENDSWWGKGFTEWANVTAAKPLYRGHNQPKLPSDLGFYDLRLDATRDAQADLARTHGVSGFMYYHYWFSGKPLLDLPINMLASGSTQFPFCIMWANENWTRSWDGGSHQILAAQTYDDDSADRFIDSIIPLLADPRYLRVGGRAILAVYVAGHIPNLERVVARWRLKSEAAGIPLYLLSVNVSKSLEALPDRKAQSAGFDGSLEFPPHMARGERHTPGHLTWRFRGRILSYRSLVDDALERLRSPMSGSDFPGVMVGFDNTARRQADANVWYGSNPYVFRKWLAAAVRALEAQPNDARLVFVNAWNEWAEGAVLEPSERFGRTYLLAVRDVVWATGQ